MRLDDPVGRKDGAPRVLFVDDDPLLIRGLRRTVTGRGLPWLVQFSQAGDAALEHLGREPFDVVVSDMSMPGMPGGELLERVQDAHPSVARIVLSGIADPAEVSRTVPWAHLALAKPFDPAGLLSAITRGIALHELLARPALRAAFGARPPGPPPVYAAVTRALARERSSVWEAMDVLEQHPRVSSRLARLAAYSPAELGRPRSRLVSYVASIEPCALRSLVLLAELGETFANGSTMAQGFSAEVFEGRALRAAHLAARIVGRRGSAERAFIAGLFHDIGELVVAAYLPAGLRRSSLGVSHAEAGALALGLFGFPLETIEAVLGLCDSAESEGTGLGVGGAAYVASVLSRDPAAPVGPGIVKGIDPGRLGRAHDPRRLEQWRRAARQLTGRATA